MSQMATRKSALADDKEKERKIDSPVKDMKKKLAANAEKEKAAEKNEKAVEKIVKNDKPVQNVDKNGKTADKTPAPKVTEKNSPASKTEKVADKNSTAKNDKAPEKPQACKNEKPADKTATSKSEKPADKTATSKSDKTADKTVTSKSEKPADKTPTNKSDKVADTADNKADKKTDPIEKGEKSGKDTAKPDQSQQTPKKTEKLHQNGNGKAELNGNGTENGTGDSCDETSCDEFPELTYDESDTEPPTPDRLSRSLTRRSQVKPMRTPETPQPNTEKPAADENQGEPKDKVLKLNEAPSDRKLRSTDSPKPQDKGAENDTQKKDNEADDKDVEMVETQEGNRKTDTNFSKSRVKVSPYRRSMRLADQTNTSMMANYTGNNTTMEMDITESSLLSEDPSLNEQAESPYLQGLRNIRGRRSYKPLKEMTFNKSINRSVISANVSGTELPTRPTGTVVGRKRKPDATPSTVEIATEVTVEEASPVSNKRMRLFEKMAQPFRRTIPVRPVEIVGINTDLPDITSPVAAPVKPDDDTTVKPSDVTSVRATANDRDAKRCIVM